MDMFLVYSSNSIIRQTIAKQGYGLDVLINDSDFGIREIAKMMKGEYE